MNFDVCESPTINRKYVCILSAIGAVPSQKKADFLYFKKEMHKTKYMNSF